MNRLTPEQKRTEIAKLKARDLLRVEKINRVRASKGLSPLKPYRKHYGRLV